MKECMCGNLRVMRKSASFAEICEICGNLRVFMGKQGHDGTWNFQMHTSQEDNRDLLVDNRDPNLLQNVHIFKLSSACNFQNVET